jgi:hypothetical protein
VLLRSKIGDFEAILGAGRTVVLDTGQNETASGASVVGSGKNGKIDQRQVCVNPERLTLYSALRCAFPRIISYSATIAWPHAITPAVSHL